MPPAISAGASASFVPAVHRPGFPPKPVRAVLEFKPHSHSHAAVPFKESHRLSSADHLKEDRNHSRISANFGPKVAMTFD